MMFVSTPRDLTLAAALSGGCILLLAAGEMLGVSDAAALAGKERGLEDIGGDMMKDLIRLGPDMCLELAVFAGLGSLIYSLCSTKKPQTQEQEKKKAVDDDAPWQQAEETTASAASSEGGAPSVEELLETATLEDSEASPESPRFASQQPQQQRHCSADAAPPTLPPAPPVQQPAQPSPKALDAPPRNSAVRKGAWMAPWKAACLNWRAEALQFRHALVPEDDEMLEGLTCGTLLAAPLSALSPTTSEDEKAAACDSEVEPASEAEGDSSAQTAEDFRLTALKWRHVEAAEKRESEENARFPTEHKENAVVHEDLGAAPEETTEEEAKVFEEEHLLPEVSEAVAEEVAEATTAEDAPVPGEEAHVLEEEQLLPEVSEAVAEEVAKAITAEDALVPEEEAKVLEEEQLLPDVSEAVAEVVAEATTTEDASVPEAAGTAAADDMKTAAVDLKPAQEPEAQKAPEDEAGGEADVEVEAETQKEQEGKTSKSARRRQKKLLEEAAAKAKEDAHAEKVKQLKELKQKRRESAEQLQELQKKKLQMSKHLALEELKRYSTCASDAIERLANGEGRLDESAVVEFTRKLSDHKRDADNLHQAIAEIADEEFPVVEKSFEQVSKHWKVTLAVVWKKFEATK